VLVAAGRGLAFVPASATLLGIPDVAYVPLATPVEQPVELHLLWPRHSRNPALGRVLVALQHLAPDNALAVSRDAETHLGQASWPLRTVTG
jgi:hypothetical protein